MKLSDFLLKKTIKYVDGMALVTEPEINGDIEFYTITSTKLKEIKEKILKDKDLEKIDQHEFLMGFLGCISNIEVDVTLEQFKDIVQMTKFVAVFEMLVLLMDELFEFGKQTQQLQEKTENLVEKHGDVISKLEESFNIEKESSKAENESEQEVIIEKPKTKEQQLEEIYSEMAKCSTFEERKVYMDKMVEIASL